MLYAFLKKGHEVHNSHRGIGKGITSASIGRIKKNKGFNVTAIRIDTYVNIDAGAMSSYQHGEVFVLKDGGEVDLDFDNYERFLDIELTREHNITTVQVYQTVIQKEWRGDYLGKTVRITPDITNEIKERIGKVARKSGADICIIEVGGTVGDIESMPFLCKPPPEKKVLNQQEQMQFKGYAYEPKNGKMCYVY